MSGQPLPRLAQELADRFVRKKVLLTGDHPHADRVGVVTSLERTWAGYGFKVDFVDSSGDGCFVFDPKHWKVLEG